jgi:uncharacterized MAPEG superfamily protein
MRDQKLQTLSKTRAILIRDLILACLISLLLWLVLYSFLSPVANMALPLDRLIFTCKCWGMATLFCLVLGIEAVSYERLGTSVVTALGDGESLRLRINQRYLQQTMEQMLVFVPSLLMLAIYCDSSESMRLVEVATIMWMGSRLVYWLNYHQDMQTRVPYTIGMLQNLLILLYCCTRFGYELSGMTGAVLVVGVFVSIEVYLLGINKL